MNNHFVVKHYTYIIHATTRYHYLLRAFFTGILFPFGFAPFHLPGLSLLSLACLFIQLQSVSLKHSFWVGFTYGLGFLGVGVSWVYVSIHEYGHLNVVLSACITLLFVTYLALYLGLVAFLFNRLRAHSPLRSCLLFSAIWCFGEYLRATLMGGFPWLLLGIGQMDTPLKYLLPVFGIYGVSFFACFTATIFAVSTQQKTVKRWFWILVFLFLLLAPALLKFNWVTQSPTPVSVGIIQANLSMRDKWDESLFWQLLQRYKDGIAKLIDHENLIVMPESAIPLPPSYVSNFLESIDLQATQKNSAILLGIPQPTSDGARFYNSISTLGIASGVYAKQHLVPFGEFIPQPFEHLMSWLGIPITNLQSGKVNQPLIQVQNHPIAALICYELAYPALLRKQLPEAEWIVSVSDDGWFGHSLAMYQQLQMAQALSLQAGRYHIVANNDGLSSVIDTQGNLMSSLPPFSSGLLRTTIYPATGSTPWVYWGDLPVLLFMLSLVVAAEFNKFRLTRLYFQRSADLN